MGLTLGKKTTFGDWFLGSIQSLINKWTGGDMTRAERQANEFSAKQSELAFNRELQASNTQYQRRVEDLQAAGLNPMFAAGQSVSLPSASNASSVTPASYSPFDLFSTINQMKIGKAQIADLNASKELKYKQKSLINSEISKNVADMQDKIASAKLKESQTKGQEFINEVNELTRDIQVEAKSLNNDLLKANIGKINKEIEDLTASIRKKEEETSNEIEKRSLMASQRALNYANVYEIRTMVQYNVALTQAKTMEAKASAALAGVQYAYQNGLINGGYIDSLCNQAAAQAGIKLNDEQLSNIKTALRTGDYSKVHQGRNIFEQLFTSEGFIQFATVFLDNFNPLSGLVGIAP